MDNKRNKILNAAICLFVEKGFHNTPTSVIAKEAGVANGTLFHYFKTKEELINTIYLEVKKELVTHSFEGIEEEDSFKSQLRQMFFQTIKWAIENKLKYLFIKHFSNSPYLNQLTKEEINQNIELYFNFIRKGIDKNIIKNIPEELAYQISNFQLDAIIFYLYNHEDLIENRDFWEQGFDLLWDMVRKN